MMKIGERFKSVLDLTSQNPYVMVVGGTLLTYCLFRWLLSKKEKPGQKNFIRQYTTIRPLDLSEKLFARIEDLQSLSQTYSVIVRGPLTPDVLRQALLMMLQKHQVLRFGIHTVDDTLYFHEFDKPQDHIDLAVFYRRDDLHWQEMAINCNDTFRSFIEDEGLLWKIKFLYNASHPHGSHDIILQCIHTIVDGSSRAIFIRDLLDFCGQIVDGTKKPIIEMKYHPGTELLLFGNRNNNRVLSFLSRVLPYPLQVIRVTLQFMLKGTCKPLMPRNVAPYYERSTAFIPFKMSKEVTLQFYNACKEHGVTFNSGFLGIVTWATQNTWQIKKKEKIEVVLPIRLRHITNPQVSRDHITFMVSSVTVHVPTVEPGLDVAKIWEYAKIVDALVHGNEGSFVKLALQEKYDLQFITPTIPLLVSSMLSGSGRYAHCMISNLGKMEVPIQYGAHLTLEGWYNIDKEQTRGNDMTHFLATFEDECCVTTQWTHPLLEQQKVEAYTAMVVDGIKVVTGLDTVEILPHLQK